MNDQASDFLPDPPTFPDEVVAKCKRSRDFRPILFEWYKYVGVLCNRAACLASDSPAFRDIPPVHYAVLIGLLNRCSRLMLANTRLSCTRRYGETTCLLDRSISESALKLIWLCQNGESERFSRYLADGLKKDLLLKAEIGKTIKKRQAKPLPIEGRMLASVERRVNLSGLSEQEISGATSFPSFQQICKDLELDEFFYIAVQRMGSHAVHGTWSDLLFNYVRYEDGKGFRPRDHEIETQDVQYLAVARFVLWAIGSYLSYLAAEPSEIDDFLGVLEAVEKELVEIQGLAWASDLETE